MGYLEIISFDSDGVTVKSVSELSESERLDIELDLVSGAPMTLVCFECYKPIPDGSGSFCEKHKHLK